MPKFWAAHAACPGSALWSVVPRPLQARAISASCRLLTVADTVTALTTLAARRRWRAVRLGCGVCACHASCSSRPLTQAKQVRELMHNRDPMSARGALEAAEAHANVQAAVPVPDVTGGSSEATVRWCLGNGRRMAIESQPDAGRALPPPTLPVERWRSHFLALTCWVVGRRVEQARARALRIT